MLGDRSGLDRLVGGARLVLAVRLVGMVVGPRLVLGSGIGLWVWSVAQWPGVCAAGAALIITALIIYLATYKQQVKTVTS